MVPREMAMADTDSTSMKLRWCERIFSAQQRAPLLHLGSTQENSDKYLKLCVPLHKAALAGDWKEVRHILEEDWTQLTAALTKEWDTVLHVAVRANHLHLVEELVNIMQGDDLELEDRMGNTAFCLAAAAGNVQIAEIMLKKNERLPKIRGGDGMMPFHMAALIGSREMASYLYPKSVEIFKDLDWTKLFLICIHSGLYDLALKMLEARTELAFVRDDNKETGLHVLAGKASICGCLSIGYGKHLLHSSCVKDTPIVALTRLLWKIVLSLDDSEMMKTITEPWHVIFKAAEVGNFGFLYEVISTYPDLIWELDNKGRSIFHIAVLNRHACIFNLIHEVRNKDKRVNFVDAEGNNLLHLAAKLAPPDQLDLVRGAASQMILELSWFEEVKKIMAPSCIEMKNAEGITPRQLFTKEHKESIEQAGFWMKETTNLLLVVSTLVATVTFSAALNPPADVNDNPGTLNYLERPAFLIFALSDAMALITSSTSILIFLSILISRHAEEEFFKSLTLKLIFGLVTLFISIISMTVAFSSLFIAEYHGLTSVPIVFYSLSFAPIPLFILVLFPPWFNIVYLVYIRSSLFRPSKHMIPK